MLKYTDTQVTFREIPDEISLCINISGCPNNCIGCHSSYLTEDIGQELTFDTLLKLIHRNNGITCVTFMGGDQDPEYINKCASVIKESDLSLKIAWYSGKDKLSDKIDLCNFDFIKLGPYIQEKGPLDNPNTNQKLYQIQHSCKLNKILNVLTDITNKFWKNN